MEPLTSDLSGVVFHISQEVAFHTTQEHGGSGYCLFMSSETLDSGDTPLVFDVLPLLNGFCGEK